MHVLHDFFLGDIKITIFLWNGKYIIKMERDGMEQTLKVPEYEFRNEEDLLRILDPDLMTESSARFDDMKRSLAGALQRNE